MNRADVDFRTIMGEDEKGVGKCPVNYCCLELRVLF